MIFSQIKFVGVDRLFVLVYSNQNDDSKTFKAKKYYFHYATDAGDDDQSKFVLAILEKVKETRLKNSQGSVRVL